MRGERRLLRAGEYLVRRACRRLPQGIRDERYREWAAELPAILHDPEIRFAPRRAVRMLSYAADTLRGACMAPARVRRRTPLETAALNLLLIAGLSAVAVAIWTAVREPGHGLTYLQLAWALLLVAVPISMFMRSTTRMTALIFISGILAGVAVSLWNAAQTPGDLLNYFVAALLVLLLLAWWLISRWARVGHGKSRGSHRAPG